MVKENSADRVIVAIDRELLSTLPADSYEMVRESTPRGAVRPSEVARLEKQVFDFFTLSQMGKSLLSIQQIEELGHVFLSSVYETSGAANCTLFLFDERDNRFKCVKAIGLDATIAGALYFEKEEGLFWQILNSGEPFPIIDSLGTIRFESVVRKWGLDKLESQVWVPLIVKNKLVGVLTLGRKSNGEMYRETELSFILQMGNQAAVAFEAAMLDEQKEHASSELAKKMDNLSILYSVSKALNFATDLKKLLLFILDKSRDAVGAAKASLMLYDPKIESLVVHVVRGIPPDVEAKINAGVMETKRIKKGEGIAGRVAETQEHMLVNDVHNDDRFKEASGSFVDSILCMPLVANDEIIGVINLTNKEAGGKFSEDDVELLSTLSSQAAITIHNARLYHLAITDGLTQLRIRRYFQQRIEEEIVRFNKFGHPLTLIMGDIDHFKSVNDTHGHQQGDLVLMETAKIFRAAIREVDIAARYGGEEFAIILPETDSAEAEQVAEAIRTQIEAHEFTTRQGKLKVTISLGVATANQSRNTSEKLIGAADQALYQAKETGRNRVLISE